MLKGRHQIQKVLFFVVVAAFNPSVPLCKGSLLFRRLFVVFWYAFAVFCVFIPKSRATAKNALFVTVAFPKPFLCVMWQIKSVFKKIKTGIRNGQSQYYSDFI